MYSKFTSSSLYIDETKTCRIVFSLGLLKLGDHHQCKAQQNVFTFGGAKRSGSDRECKYFPVGMNAREPLWR